MGETRQEWERQEMEGDRKYEELEEREKVRQRNERWEWRRKSRFSMEKEIENSMDEGSAEISGGRIKERRW